MQKTSFKSHKRLALFMKIGVCLAVLLLGLFLVGCAELLPNTTNKVKLVPSEMEEYSVSGREIYRSCAGLESFGEHNGISNMKSKSCREFCGKRNMEYYSNDCEKDLFVIVLHKAKRKLF